MTGTCIIGGLSDGHTNVEFSGLALYALLYFIQAPKNDATELLHSFFYIYFKLLKGDFCNPISV